MLRQPSGRQPTPTLVANTDPQRARAWSPKRSPVMSLSEHQRDRAEFAGVSGSGAERLPTASGGRSRAAWRIRRGPTDDQRTVEADELPQETGPSESAWQRATEGLRSVAARP